LAELDEKINAIKQALLRKTKESKSKEAERLLRWGGGGKKSLFRILITPYIYV